MLALATDKTRSSAGGPAGFVSHCACIHTSTEPQGISWTERAANYRNSQRATGHPLQACWKHMPLPQAGEHPLSSPALTRLTHRTKALEDRASLPQTCQALTTEPLVLPCWLSLQKVRKQVHKEALSKPLTLLLLAATRGQSIIHRCIYIYIYIYCYQQGADDIKIGEFSWMDRSLAVPGDRSCSSPFFM